MAKKTTTTEAPAETEAPALVTVTATGFLTENGVFYKAGDTFETSIRRATALGDLVILPSP